MPENPLLEIRDLKKHFPIVRGFFNKVVGQVRAVDGISFSLYQGECLGLVGESGSGKTTVGRTILRAYDPTDGEIRFHLDGEEIDIVHAPENRLKELRRHMQMIFQDPYASLNPRMSIFEIISEPLLIHGVNDRSEREGLVRRLMEQVGLNPQHLRRYPHAFSGGQRQRIGVARALALRPQLIIADEPVSALDVSVQAQILNLLQQLRRDLGLTYLFIAHDLSVIRHIADRVAVMYLGKIVEIAPVDRLFAHPSHPYTEALLAAVPAPNPQIRKAPLLLTGEVADPANPPPGCPFHTRCRYATSTCQHEVPNLRETTTGHQVSCHLSEELDLQGMQ